MITPEERDYIGEVIAEDAALRDGGFEGITAELVPAAAGKVEVLLNSLERFESEGEDFVKLLDVRDITAMIRANVARLTAENARLQNDVEHLRERSGGHKSLCAKHAEILKEREAMQSELTKARELLTSTYDVCKFTMASGTYVQVRDFLANQSAPAAKGAPQHSDVNDIPALQNEWVKS